MKIEPWGYTVDLTRVQSASSLQKHHQVSPEDLELEATDYRELDPPAAGDRPQHRPSDPTGLITVAAGLFILICFVLSVGYVAGATYHWLQHQGGQTDVRR